MNVKTLTHSQQQPQAPKAHKKKSTVRLTSEQCSGSPKGLFFTDSWYRMQDTHSAKEDSVENSPETVNLTENAEQHTFKAPCCCFENTPHTGLLFIRQSMYVSIDCN